MTPGAGGGLSGVLARGLVAGRWLVVVAWLAAVGACLAFLPAQASGGGGLSGLLSGDTPAVEAELRSVELFGFPLVARTVVVQRDPSGLSPYAQARTVVRALAVDRGRAGDVDPLLGAIPVTNTLGLFPGSRETGTTSLTYLLYGADASLGQRTRSAEDYAERFFTERDDVVGVTGSAPARSQQGAIIRDALPGVEAITLLAIVLIVGFAFRSLVAPLIALVAAGVSFVVTLRLTAYFSDLLGLASPDELEPVVIALLLGVVTDYVIFFCSSLRDQQPALLRGQGTRAEVRAASIAATTASVRRSGPIVAVAGLAVAAGTATLLAAESPFFRALGPALAFTVTVGLVVAITLVPALMAILGGLVFWPSRRPGEERRRALSGRLGAVGARWRSWTTVRTPQWPAAVIDRTTASRRAGLLVLVPCLAGLALSASLVLRLDLGVSFIGALPPGSEIRATAAQAQDGFAEGILSPTELVVEGDDVAERRGALRELGTSIARLPGVAGVLGPGSQPGPVERLLLLSDDGDAARYLVILDSDPLGADAVATTNLVQAALPGMLREAGLAGTSVALAGDSATAAYLVEQTEADLLRIALTALVANLLMLLLFLRAVVASIALLATSLLSLGATLGITSLVFDLAAPGQGLTFYVPFAAAVLLLAFASDYNIFTVGHVWEDAEGRTLRAAVRHALPSSVSAVVTAGLALGTSFALLSLVPLAPFSQLAFAVGLGIALEIVVVRLLVVPALLTVLGPRAAWPSSRFGARRRMHGPAGR
ncbi:putative transport protein MmpL9 [Nocardioides aquaticus]|uniref:Transport protein MmpL9 n=1 Tax=Nocardioides aquaticus TaxID=160826 RepID=A0ABX8EDK2_9ACTN|nr:MMPL family transporter [Nocardioides aquaticus]QVT78504.1 putative transport protein MmpL9 [Nocardioides aquaticus]